MASYCEQIQNHYAKAWSAYGEIVSFARGPKSDLPSDFAVLRFAPHEGRNMWTYATRCMSQKDDLNPIELHVFSNLRADELAEVLTAVSHYHRFGKSLDLYHTINIGKAWAQHSLCDFGLISLPYLDGPTLECGIADGQNVRFLWLIPINEAEKIFASKYGVEALEQRFDDAHVDYSNPYRESVV